MPRFGRLDAVAREAAELQGVPGVALAIVDGGEIVHELCVGELQRGQAIPIDRETLFPTASITKAFTALVVHELVSEGRLELDAPLSPWLHGLVARDARVSQLTLRALLTHTAGLTDYDPVSWADDAREDPRALEDTVRRALAEQVVDDSLGRYRYCNLGYDIAGFIAARTHGETFEDAVTARILEPLGMTASCFYPESQGASHRAIGHVGDGHGGVLAYNGPLGSRSHAPSGTLSSTLRDMQRFVLALTKTDGPLSGTRDALFTEQVATARADLTACLGVRKRHHRYGAVYEHGGWDPGYRCAFFVCPERQAGGVVLTNFHWTAPLHIDWMLDTLLGEDVALTSEQHASLKSPAPSGR